MGKERRTFSAEFKRDAVARIAASGEGLTQTARSLGIHPSLLLSWRRKLAVMNEAGVTRNESLEFDLIALVIRGASPSQRS